MRFAATGETLDLTTMVHSIFGYIFIALATSSIRYENIVLMKVIAAVTKHKQSDVVLDVALTVISHASSMTLYCQCWPVRQSSSLIHTTIFKQLLNELKL